MTEIQTSLSKRIRRHITGRIKDFFAVTAPGFEQLCFDELMSLPLSVKEASVVTGGVEFKARIHDCWLANLSLRTASRILMRIAIFKACNFSQLEKKLAEIPWELFLHPDDMPELSVTARHSRLYHKDAVAERFQTGIAECFRRSGEIHPRSDSHESIAIGEEKYFAGKQKIFVRAEADHFVVSIDSSGELLYKRGIKKQGGPAPLRETIAAAALKLAGYNYSEPLTDPLCGAGTFSLEGAMMAANMPPGFLREFAFMGWPSFMPRRWSYIKSEAQKGIIRIDNPCIFASDKDRDTCNALENCVRENDLAGIVRVSCLDFFGFSPRKLTKQTGLIVLNPPYGLRIGTQAESHRLFHEICRKLKKDYRNWKVALIAADPELIKAVPFKTTPYFFFHGGLKPALLTGRI